MRMPTRTLVKLSCVTPSSRDKIKVRVARPTVKRQMTVKTTYCLVRFWHPRFDRRCEEVATGWTQEAAEKHCDEQEFNGDFFDMAFPDEA